MPRKAASKKSNHAQTTEAASPAVDGDHWELILYIAGQTPKSLTAFSNLKRFCEENVPGKYSIQVIDLAKNPHLAKSHQILAIPTLVRKLPTPLRKIIGDLSDKQKVLLGFDPKPMS